MDNPCGEKTESKVNGLFKISFSKEIVLFSSGLRSFQRFSVFQLDTKSIPQCIEQTKPNIKFHTNYNQIKTISELAHAMFFLNEFFIFNIKINSLIFVFRVSVNIINYGTFCDVTNIQNLQNCNYVMIFNFFKFVIL